MGNPLIIENKGTPADKLNALINVVNILTTQMYEGRVKQAQIDIQDGKETAAQHRMELDAASITFVTLAEAGQIDEQTALKHKEQFEGWVADVVYDVDQMRVYEDRLYKCRQKHTSQSDWTPDIVPNLWKAIDFEHAGTFEDPIPAVANMEYVHGKYYIEDGVIYQMKREGMVDGERIVLAFTPSQLVGHYFVVVDDNVEEVATDNAEVV